MNRIRRESPKQVVYDVLLWAVLSVLVSAAGPDPLDDPAGFLLITGTRLVLLAVAILLGRPWPPSAVLLMVAIAPWDLSEGLATSQPPPEYGLGWQVKIFPASVLTPAIMWYAYLAGRRLTRVWPALAAFAAVTLAGCGLVAREGGALGLWVTMATGLVGNLALPYLVGVLRRLLAQQREQAQHSLQEQARLRERARIAHDMHDSLGHDLALIAVRAAGLELSPGLTPAQVTAAGELRVAAADATERLRQIIGLLRDQTDAAPLRPAGENVADLVERARQSGMTITLDVAGEPALAHRVVQEGLTNAAKHAPGAPVTVNVSASRVTVRNGAPHGRSTAVTGGMGLAGLRERVRLAGGTLTAGPSGDGYELTVELPRAGEPDHHGAGGAAAPGGARWEHEP